jgi:hypothetical protein
MYRNWTVAKFVRSEICLAYYDVCASLIYSRQFAHLPQECHNSKFGIFELLL